MAEATTKPTAYEMTKELTDRLEAGTKELLNSDKYRDYLKAMSVFHNYSRRNILLIHLQKPGATRVASFKLWESEFNRHPKKGEKSIRIFAPIANKTPEKKLMEKLDPETGAPLLDENGKVIMEEMTALTSGVKFKLVPVFDIEQTYGDPLPQIVENLTGDVEHYGAFVDALRAVSPLPVYFEPLPDEQDGYCRFGKNIGIREGMSEIQTVAAIVHEITHARLHDKDLVADKDKPKSKEVKEIEAESLAYVVCQHYGIETGANSFGYLASWGSSDMKEFTASLDTIRKEANTVITAVDGHFKQICKERGIDLSPKEPEQAAAVPEPSKEPEYTAETRTENIAGVDFEVTNIKPETPERENGAVSPSFSAEELREMEIYQFAADYTDHVTAIHGTTVRMDKAEREDAINGIADLMIKGNIAGIQEALDRALHKYSNPGQASELTERLNTLFPKDVPVTEAGIQAPDTSNTDFIMPDPLITVTDRDAYGYTQEDMLPLTTNRAVDMFAQGYDIYLLNADNTETMAIYMSDIDKHDGICGVDKTEWQNSKGYLNLLTLRDEMMTREAEKAQPVGYLIFADSGEKVHYYSDADIVSAYKTELASLGIFGVKYGDVTDTNLRQKLSDVFFNEMGGSPEEVKAEEKPIAEPVVQRKLSEMPGLNLNQENKAPPMPMPAPDPEPVKAIDVPVYTFGLEIARANGEMDKWQANRKVNDECAAAIDKAVSDNHPEMYMYDLKTAAKTVLAEYGAERVNYVLAATVQHSFNDGRFSSSNHAWAKGFEVPSERPTFFINTHKAILDGLINRVREAGREKPSLLEALKAGEAKSKAAAKAEPVKDAQKTKNRMEV